jgi:hypothetical protein
MEVSGQFHAPAALPPEKESLVPMNRKLGGPQNRSEHGSEERNSQPLPGFEPPIIQPVASAIPVSHPASYWTKKKTISKYFLRQYET